MNIRVHIPLVRIPVGNLLRPAPDAGHIGHQTQLDDGEGQAGTQQGPESDMEREHIGEISR